MPDPVDLGFAVKLPPRDAIAYFRSKGYAISWNWWEVWQEAHAKAFTVAKATRMDVLESIRGEVQRALDDGITAREFVKTLEPRLRKMGWWGRQVIVDPAGGAEVVQLGSPWRLRNIYRTNLQTAYMAGRYKAQIEITEGRPWWLYIAVIDSRTRPGHRALNGRVFRFDDPIWKTDYPPNGWGCRCRVRALSDRRLRSKGLTAESSSGRLKQFTVDAGIDKRTGEVIEAQVTGWRYTDAQGQLQHFKPDAGWSYNPGAAGLDNIIDFAGNKAKALPQPARTQAQRDIDNIPAALLWNRETPDGKWHEASFSDSPEWIREAVGKAGPIDRLTQDGSGAYHDRGTINMPSVSRQDSRKDQGTWRHEFGHFIDFRLRGDSVYRSSQSDFTDAMKADAKAMLSGSALGRKSKKQDARRERLNRVYDSAIVALRDADDKDAFVRSRFEDLGLDFDDVQSALGRHTLIEDLSGIGKQGKYVKIAKAIEEKDGQGLLNLLESQDPIAAEPTDGLLQSRTWEKGIEGKLSDLFSAATKKKIEGSGRHSKSYYDKRRGYGQQTECFANITCLVSDENSFWSGIVEKFTPRMYNLFKEIIDNEL